MSKRYPASTICEGRECIPSIVYINVFFLLDHPSHELDKEKNLLDDIVYLNTTEHGWNNNFAKKYITGISL